MTTDLSLDALLKHFAKLVAVEVAALANGNGNGHQPPEEREPDKLLDAKATSERIGMTVRWVYSHASTLPFRVTLPNSRAVRFSERGISRWLQKRQG